MKKIKKCKRCKQKFMFESQLLRHQSTWQCDKCKQKFTFESQLLRHQSTHTDKKPFKCASKTCPKFKEGFKSQQALERHMDVHKGKLIKCDILGCPKSFSTCHYLRDHKNTAHGQPYECKHVLDGMTAHSNANHAKHFWTTINFSVHSIQVDLM